jgi:hypothetical protein
VAWVAAIFGLVGVVVGGLITFGIEWRRERRNDGRAKLRATRLVAAEMRHGRAAIGYGRLHDRWWPEPIDFEEWRRQADTLTAVLSRADWEAVRQAYDELRATERGRAVGFAEGSKPGPAVIAELRESVAAIDAAVKVLERDDPDAESAS